MDDKGEAEMLILQTLIRKLILTTPCQNRPGLNLINVKFPAKQSEFADHLPRQGGRAGSTC